MEQARPFRRLRTTNEDATAFASKIPTTTEPTNDGVLNLTLNGNHVPERIKLIPILLGADNDVSSMRVLGWHSVLLSGSTVLWVPVIIAEYVCTASTQVGVAGSAVLATERFCDTITPVAARQRDFVIAAGTVVNSDYAVLSPVNNTTGHVVIPVAAFEKLEVTSDQTTGTSTFNVLFSLLDDDD